MTAESDDLLAEADQYGGYYDAYARLIARGLEIILRSARARGDDAIEVVGNLERRAGAAGADRDLAAVVRDALLVERERMAAEVEALRTKRDAHTQASTRAGRAERLVNVLAHELMAIGAPPNHPALDQWRAFLAEATPQPARCTKCGGSGWLDNYQRDGCKACGGGAYRPGSGEATPQPEAEEQP